jgi:hypothetical protein
VSRPINFADPAEVRAWAVDLRVAVDDADAIIRDMLRPLRRRELGARMYRDNYADARQRIVALIAAALPDEGPDHGDPSGNGGAGPAH